MGQNGSLSTRQGYLVYQFSQVVATLVFELFNEGQLLRVVLIICQCLAYKHFLISSEIFAAIFSWKLLLSPFCRLLAEATVSIKIIL